MKITDVNDYVEEVAKQFPDLTQDEIKRILVYGWRMILQYVSAGNDVRISKGKLFLFIGTMPKNTFVMFKNYCYKLSKRISYMYKRLKATWDGHYYFARSENQYMEYLKQSKKKYKVFKDVFLYKLLDEVKVREHGAIYIFRLSEDKTQWVRKYYKELKTDKAELIIQRDPLNMQDLMISNNNYKYIQ